MDIRPASLSDPDALRLIEEVQGEYVRRYGGRDDAPIEATEFAEPDGRFLLAYRPMTTGFGSEAVAMGGWRRHGREHLDTAWTGGAAEVKRMYVVPSARGQGYARGILQQLESSATAAGINWLVLETGYKQPEAIALYRSAGYLDVPRFGHYATTPGSVHLGKPLQPGAEARLANPT
jgi:GNAT superfamily N-acetyltransferase